MFILGQDPKHVPTLCAMGAMFKSSGNMQVCRQTAARGGQGKPCTFMVQAMKSATSATLLRLCWCTRPDACGSLRHSHSPSVRPCPNPSPSASSSSFMHRPFHPLRRHWLTLHDDAHGKPALVPDVRGPFRGIFDSSETRASRSGMYEPTLPTLTKTEPLIEVARPLRPYSKKRSVGDPPARPRGMRWQPEYGSLCRELPGRSCHSAIPPVECLTVQPRRRLCTVCCSRGGVHTAKAHPEAWFNETRPP